MEFLLKESYEKLKIKKIEIENQKMQWRKLRKERRLNGEKYVSDDTSEED